MIMVETGPLLLTWSGLPVIHIQGIYRGTCDALQGGDINMREPS
jgi:hypothetical protein